MARLTLSEQVSSQAATIVELTNELRLACETNTSHRANIDLMQAQLNNLREEVNLVPQLKADLIKMTAERDSSKASYGHRDRAADKAEAEIEQVNCMLDDIEGAPSRDYEVEGGYGKRQRSLLARVAGTMISVAKNKS